MRQSRDSNSRKTGREGREELMGGLDPGALFLRSFAWYANGIGDRMEYASPFGVAGRR